MGRQCSECIHFSCRGDEYISNCAVCRNRSHFVDRLGADNQTSAREDYIGGFSNPSYRRPEPVTPVSPSVSPRNESAKDVKDATLRDKFAMIALQNPSLDLANTSARQIAKICYDIADAMISIR